jgi:molecular chaperone GrpE
MEDNKDKIDAAEEVQDGNDYPVEETSPEQSSELNIDEAELEQARAKAEEYLDGWQRARAEFANYKKRVERDQSQVYQNAAGSVIKRFLEIVDDLERALKNKPGEAEGAAWSNGIELIYRKFLNILEAEGIQRIDAEGKEFDPNFHEAITQEDSDAHESGYIIEVVQHGYLIGDRVLRPALVRVAR